MIASGMGFDGAEHAAIKDLSTLIRTYASKNGVCGFSAPILCRP